MSEVNTIRDVTKPQNSPESSISKKTPIGFMLEQFLYRDDNGYLRVDHVSFCAFMQYRGYDKDKGKLPQRILVELALKKKRNLPQRILAELALKKKRDPKIAGCIASIVDMIKEYFLKKLLLDLRVRRSRTQKLPAGTRSPSPTFLEMIERHEMLY